MIWDFLFKRRELTEPNLPQERNFGEQARRLAADPAFQRAIMSVRQGIHLQWSESPVMDKDGQHELRLLLKLLNDLEGNIKHEMDSGLMAQKQLEQEAQQRKISTIRK